MPVLTAATLKVVLSISISDALAEAMIDLSVDLLNLYGADLQNMSGVAESKTLTLDTKEHGAVVLVAESIYKAFYALGSGAASNYSLGGFSVSTSTSQALANADVKATVLEAARRILACNVRKG